MSAADTSADATAAGGSIGGATAPAGTEGTDPDGTGADGRRPRGGAGRRRRSDSALNWSRMVASAGPRAPRSLRMRLLRSELGMVFRRRRNQVALGVLAAVPILIAVAVKVVSPGGGGGRAGGSGGGPPFLDQITHNGVFVAFTALAAVVPLFLPLALAVVAGDAVAGEGSLGTLRYLLVVPVARTRVLAVKYAGIVAYCLVATLAVAAVGAVTGLILFGNGPATLLSGTQIGLGSALWRLFLVGLYVAGCMAAVGAIGLFVSTLVEAPMAATAATAGLCIASAILDSVPQIDVIHPYLPSHYWLAFGDLLRDPMSTDAVSNGLLSVAAYVAVFSAFAWARFGGKDVTS